MKKLFFLLLLLCLAPAVSWAQGVGLGVPAPNASAMLDVTSTSKGVLIPRMTTAQRTAIASPAQGLLVYDTTTNGFWFYNGTAWQNLSSAGGSGRARSVYFPAAALSYPANGTGITRNSRWGFTAAANAVTAGLVVPRPLDWDDSQPFSVTLYYALPGPTPGGVVSWRLQAGGAIINTTSANANNGWDSFSFWTDADAAPANIPAVTSGYFDLAKSQTWTAQFSSTNNTWYFGTGVNVSNSFNASPTGNPMWYFGFRRGRNLSGNPETYSGDLIVNGVSINYTAR